MSHGALLILFDAFVYLASTCCYSLSADESSMMLLKMEYWHAVPWWVNVSSFKDSVDGAGLLLMSTVSHFLSMMLLKRECWHATPWWVNVSSFKDGVDGATLDEHRQPFLSKRAPA